jgi:hypothetical protein
LSTEPPNVITAAVISRRYPFSTSASSSLEALREIGEPDHVGEHHGDPATLERLGVERERAVHQTLHDLSGQEARQLAGPDELGDLLVDAGLEPAARVLELCDVVIQDVEAARLILLLFADREDLHVHERAVLAGTPTDPSERRAAPRFLRPRGRLRVQLRIPGDEVVEVLPQSLVGRVAEQQLGGRVPERDHNVPVHHDDRGRARLDEGLEEAPLPHELAHVLVQGERADELAVDHDRHRADRHVDERAVLPGAPGHELGRAVEHMVVQRGGLVTHGVVLGHEVVDVASDRLLAGPPEQPLGGRIPGGDEEGRVARHDRGRARLDQGLAQAGLPIDRFVGHRGEA